MTSSAAAANASMPALQDHSAQEQRPETSTADSPTEAHDHSSPVETYLTAFCRAKRLAIGPYLIPIANFQSDVSRLRQVYMLQAKDFGYSEFVRIWNDAHFSLVHFGTPTPFGRDVWMNAWYALLLELAAAVDVDGWKLCAFSVYATFTLWKSQPGHLGPRIPVPITPRGLDFLVERVEAAVRQGKKLDEGDKGLLVLDVAKVLRHAIQTDMFLVTDWVGGNDETIPAGQDHSWIQGVAGDGWTRALALTRFVPPLPSTSASSTLGMAHPLADDGGEQGNLTGMAYVRHTLCHHSRTPVLPASALHRLDTHAQRYAAQRDTLVQLGVLSPPFVAPAPAEDQAQRVTPHLTHFVGTLHHQIGQYHNARAVRMRDAVDAIRKLGARKRKEQDDATGLRAGTGEEEPMGRAPGRAFRPPPMARNKGGRPNDVTRWAMGRLEVEDAGQRTTGSWDHAGAMEVDP